MSFIKSDGDNLKENTSTDASGISIRSETISIVIPKVNLKPGITFVVLPLFFSFKLLTSFKEVSAVFRTWITAHHVILIIVDLVKDRTVVEERLIGCVPAAEIVDRAEIYIEIKLVGK